MPSGGRQQRGTALIRSPRRRGRAAWAVISRLSAFAGRHGIAIATLPKCAPLAMWANAALASLNGNTLSTTGFMRLTAILVGIRRARRHIDERRDVAPTAPALAHAA